MFSYKGVDSNMSITLTKLTKGLLASSLSLSVLLAGCTSEEVVTPENAPNEVLKEIASINSETEPTEVRDILKSLIQVTSDASDSRLILTDESTNEGLNKEVDTLEVISVPFKAYDVRYGANGSFYEVYEEEGAEESIYRLMDSAAKTITTLDVQPTESEKNAFANDKASLEIKNIEVRESGLADADQERLDESITSAVIYPLYNWLGSGLLIQPMARPDQYDFSLEKQGSDYVWVVTMKDKEAYNELVDSSYQITYKHDRKDIRGDESFILDTYEVEEVKMQLTMDADGSLKEIEYLTKSKATKDEESAEMTSTEKVTIQKAPTSWAEFFKVFYQAIADDKLKEGDAFVLFNVESVPHALSTSEASSNSSKIMPKADGKDTEEQSSSSKDSSTKSSDSTKSTQSKESQSESKDEKSTDKASSSENK